MYCEFIAIRFLMCSPVIFLGAINMFSMALMRDQQVNEY